MTSSVLARLGEDDDLLFLSDNFAVTASLFSGDTVFVTFQSGTGTPGLHRPGFGEPFFRKRQIAAIHVVPAVSGWYQHHEMIRICEIIRKVASRYKRIVTYGSSMGGYAAINFAHLIGATDVIAFSAQYTIDPARAPKETRYLSALDRMPDGFVYDQPAGRDWSKTRVNVVFDQFDQFDTYQAELVAENIPSAHLIELGYATHPITAVLSNDGLKNFLMAYPKSPDEAIAGLYRDYDASKEQSWLYWLAIAKRNPKAPGALDAIQKAIALNPEQPQPYLVMGNILMFEKSYKKAKDAFDLCYLKDKKSPLPFIGKVRAFLMMKDPEKAQISLDDAKKRNGDARTIADLQLRIDKASGR